MRIASIAGEEIDAVELAITMRDQHAEYYKILEQVKEELGFDAYSGFPSHPKKGH